jgi:quinol monooxygenase YgiN
MIFITATFRVDPEHADRWAEISRPFTEATRAEPGCLWFRWSRSLDDPTEYVLVEAFRDGEAGGAHVQSDHFKQAQRELPQYLVETPKIVTSRWTRRGGRSWASCGWGRASDPDAAASGRPATGAARAGCPVPPSSDRCPNHEVTRAGAT